MRVFDAPKAADIQAIVNPEMICCGSPRTGGPDIVIRVHFPDPGMHQVAMSNFVGGRKADGVCPAIRA